MPPKTATRWLEGWALTGWAALFAAGGAGLIMAARGTDAEAMGAVLRFTARTSYALYLAAFVAAPLAAVSAAPLFRRLRANRRYLGLGFAASHAVHLAAILRLGQLQPGVYDAGTLALGGLGYVFLAAMTATSFKPTARLIGPRAWKALHQTGMYYLGLIFVGTTADRIGAQPFYVLFPAAFAAAWALRVYVAARVRPRARAGAAY